MIDHLHFTVSGRPTSEPGAHLEDRLTCTVKVERSTDPEWLFDSEASADVSLDGLYFLATVARSLIAGEQNSDIEDAMVDIVSPDTVGRDDIVEFLDEYIEELDFIMEQASAE